jgi:dehydrogenase/reductase SDR family protein 4
VSSIGGLVPFHVLGPYSTSKTALLGLTKALTPGCASMGIRVNGVAPGVIRTNFSRAIWENEEALQVTNENCALKRIGEPGLTFFQDQFHLKNKIETVF